MTKVMSATITQTIYMKWVIQANVDLVFVCCNRVTWKMRR